MCGLPGICAYCFASTVLFFNIWDTAERSAGQRKPKLSNIYFTVISFFRDCTVSRQINVIQ